MSLWNKGIVAVAAAYGVAFVPALLSWGCGGGGGGAASKCSVDAAASGDDGAIPKVDGASSDSARSAHDAADAHADDAQPDATPAETGAPGDGGACPQAAGSFILYAIPSPATLDWSTPNNLLNTTFASVTAGQGLVTLGDAVLSHEIGHVNLELDCGGTSIPLTGQTGGGSEFSSLGDGVGIMFRDWPGSLNEWDDPIGQSSDTVQDIAAREASGNLTIVKFVVNQAMCQRLKDFHDQYVASLAYTNYGSFYRARRFEGAGCAIFGAAFVDVGGLLRRSLFTPVWSQTEIVGSARFVNYQGTNAFFPYGSNTVARDSTGKDWIWPAGVNIPADTSSMLVPETPVLDNWTGPEDTPFSIPGVTLTGPMVSAVPFNLYDPTLIASWAEGVYTQATKAKGAVSSLGGSWTGDSVKSVHRITYDAHCVMPQTIAFDADNDDLFKDSDAP